MTGDNAMKTDKFLGVNSKKVLKIIHVLLSACIFGAFAAVLILLILKQNYDLGEMAFAVDLSILKVFTYGISYVFFALLLTAAIYGLFTEWGFVKHRWILAKLIILSALAVVTLVGLSPSINGMASISDAGLNTNVMRVQYLNFGQMAIFYASINLVLMMIIFSISILKPWGKTGWELKQKTKLMILLPLIVLAIGFSIFNGIKLTNIRNMPIANINLSSIKDGTYKGEAKSGSYVYKVKVSVKDHKIIDIVGVDNRESPYVTYAEGVFAKIIKQQKADVDAVTGASSTSKAFMKAVENALSTNNK